MRNALTPGVLSPRRIVPAGINAPEYVGKKGPTLHKDGHIPSQEIVEKMRIAGRIAAEAMNEAAKAIAPGVTTDEIDRIGHEYLLDHGAYPSTLGDTDATYPVGDISEEATLLIERTREALDRAIAAVKPGREINVIGRVIEAYAGRFGYGVVKDFTGHGINTAFHSGLIVPHFDAPYHDTIIEEGMTFTIEPMLTLGSIDYEIWDDSWTVVTKDRKWSAQFEHTLLVTSAGAEILTLAAP